MLKILKINQKEESTVPTTVFFYFTLLLSFNGSSICCTVLSGVISSPDSWFLPIQFRNSDLSMFVNSTVIKRQANFSYSKKYAQHFLLQAFFIILMFSHFKHQNYVSFTTRVSESIRCKAVALVLARAHCCGGAQNCICFPTLAKKNRPINNFCWGFF